MLLGLLAHMLPRAGRGRALAVALATAGFAAVEMVRTENWQHWLISRCLSRPFGEIVHSLTDGALVVPCFSAAAARGETHAAIRLSGRGSLDGLFLKRRLGEAVRAGVGGLTTVSVPGIG